MSTQVIIEFADSEEAELFLKTTWISFTVKHPIHGWKHPNVRSISGGYSMRKGTP